MSEEKQNKDPVGEDYLDKEIQVRNEVKNYTGGINSTVEKSFGSL